MNKYLFVFFLWINAIMAQENNSGKIEQNVKCSASNYNNEIFLTILHSKNPTNETPLSNEQYTNVIDTFIWWAKRIINTEYLPSDGYMKQNIQLFKSTKQHNEDIAVLSFKIADQYYRLVQTGGFLGKLYLFLINVGNNVNMPKERIKYMQETVVNSILSISKTNQISLIVNNVTDDQWLGISHYNGVEMQCLSFEGAICISVPKLAFGETLAAREPMPNNWFLWEEGKKQKKVP